MGERREVLDDEKRRGIYCVETQSERGLRYDIKEKTIKRLSVGYRRDGERERGKDGETSLRDESCAVPPYPLYLDLVLVLGRFLPLKRVPTLKRIDWLNFLLLPTYFIILFHRSAGSLP